MISAGNKVAKATHIKLAKSEGGAMCFEIDFTFLENGNPNTLKWNGWLKNKAGETTAMERTIDTMMNVLDYNGDSDVVNVPDSDPRKGDLVNQNAINLNKEVQIVVKHEAYKNEKGEDRTSTKIAFVNALGGGGYAGLSPEEAKGELNAIGFKAMVQAKRGNRPAPQPQVSQDDLPY